jgi:hypothetical protein
MIYLLAINAFSSIPIFHSMLFLENLLVVFARFKISAKHFNHSTFNSANPWVSQAYFTFFFVKAPPESGFSHW